MTIYQANKGAGFANTEAQKIGEAVERIGDQVTPDDVVDAARAKRSPLHHLFQWDDTLAAVRWRRQEARNILNHLAVVVTMPDGVQQPIKAFHSMSWKQNEDDGTTRRYVHVSVVKASPDIADDVIDRARVELGAWQRRYHDYREFFGSVFSAIDDAVGASNGSGGNNKNEKTVRKTVGTT